LRSPVSVENRTPLGGTPFGRLIEVGWNMKRALPSLLLVVAILASGVNATLAADRELPPLPPLNEPATEDRLPGKFIWADMFTSDISGTRQFFAGLFGWDWRWISEQPGHRYGIFFDDGVAVAGVAHWEAPGPDKTYARWIHYISVEDVAAAASRALDRGSRTLLERHDIAHRGEFAILADPEGAPFGIMNSSSGDPPDFRSEIGEWLWVGLFARSSAAASKFYASSFGYDVHERDDHPEVLDFVLAEGGYSRAGIGELSPGSRSNPTWLGFVRVEDVGAALDKTRTLGGEVLYEPQSDALRGELAIIADPLGAPIGLMQWSYPEEADSEEVSQP
jgi:predicted enzyme related to lactoylglutathione lyase